MLRRGGIEEDVLDKQIKLVKGFFHDSLPKFKGTKVSFLHLDVDLYQSYKETLEYFWPRVSTGGVILFDESANDGILGL